MAVVVAAVLVLSALQLVPDAAASTFNVSVIADGCVVLV
jgi:hypothetical protein